ncbi:MAG: hypothetical protein FJZ12_03660 [Candidatus Omnitrophica bacterium]|nr:hypothetical protein [Candidatus Omnitrophota bacterium]
MAEVLAKALVEAPVYHRKATRPKYLARVNKLDLKKIKEPKDFNSILLRLLKNPTLSGKGWIFKHASSRLAKNIIVPCGSDAGVALVPNTKKAIAATTDCNSTYCYLDPFSGGAIAVAEAARNIACSGGKPLAITDGINFGNPKNPEVFWQFKQAALGISKACRALNTPVVSGNVSFNNENPKGSVDPTPIVGMVGVLQDKNKAMTQYFKGANDAVILLGKNKEELGGSEYLKTIFSLKKGKCPSLDLRLEKSLQKTVLELINKKLVKSAHDCSEGGLAVALAECCITKPGKRIGVEVKLKEDKIRTDALLFGESQSRVILSAKNADVKKILLFARKNKVPACVIGRTGGDNLVVEGLINLPVSKLYKAWSMAIESYL